MIRTLLATALVLAGLTVTAAIAQDGPMVLTPPATGEDPLLLKKPKKPKPAAPATAETPIDLNPTANLDTSGGGYDDAAPASPSSTHDGRSAGRFGAGRRRDCSACRCDHGSARGRDRPRTADSRRHGARSSSPPCAR